MLTFAPNYLSYLMNSDRPSVLTKVSNGCSDCGRTESDVTSLDLRHVYLQDQESKDWREAESRLCGYGGKTSLWNDVLRVLPTYIPVQHLFFDQQVTMKFDLKGISTRVAKAKGEGRTLWDADWVENFQTRLLVHAHHKT